MLQFGLFYLSYEQDVIRNLDSVESINKMDFYTLHRKVQIGGLCLKGNLLYVSDTLKYL